MYECCTNAGFVRNWSHAGTVLSHTVLVLDCTGTALARYWWCSALCQDGASSGQLFRWYYAGIVLIPRCALQCIRAALVLGSRCPVPSW